MRKRHWGTEPSSPVILRNMKCTKSVFLVSNSLVRLVLWCPDLWEVKQGHSSCSAFFFSISLVSHVMPRTLRVTAKTSLLQSRPLQHLTWKVSPVMPRSLRGLARPFLLQCVLFQQLTCKFSPVMPRSLTGLARPLLLQCLLLQHFTC